MKTYILISTDYGYYDDKDVRVQGVYSTQDNADKIKRRLFKMHDRLEIQEVELDEYCEEDK